MYERHGADSSRGQPLDFGGAQRSSPQRSSTILLIAGCGSAAKVDKGGFSDGDRKNATTALDTLKGTAIPETIVQLTATIGLPAVCRIHRSNQDSKLFNLIMAWKPLPRTDGAYTWFTASIGSKGADPASLHLGVSPSLKAMETHYGVAYSHPFDPCQIDAFGNVSVVPWETSYPPTGKARKLPE